MQGVQEVLSFWFSDEVRPRWYEVDPAFDQRLRDQFGELFARAEAGQLRAWEDGADGCLALCLLLDQFPRNMFRGEARAFATDDRALAVAEQALAEGFDQQLSLERRHFLYLPFMHSEVLANQLRALALFEAAGLHDGRRYAAQHVDIIRRFGRFPHRNAILGRASTARETMFLLQHGEDFGQRARGVDAARRPDVPPEPSAES